MKKSLQENLARNKMDDVLNHYYKAFIHNEKDHQLHYRLLNPSQHDDPKKYPLVIFLHGSAERGDDNTSQLKNCA